MKRFVAVFLAAVMLGSTPVFADGIVYNNTEIAYADKQPVVIEGHTYVPVKDVFEALGYEVEWNGEDKSVTFSTDYESALLMTQTSNLFVMRNTGIPTFKKLGNEVKLIDGRTMLPLREILEALEYTVSYDADTKTSAIAENADKVKVTEDEINKTIENIPNISYSFDSSKPAGTLTDEERAYINNYFETLELAENLSEAEQDVDYQKDAELVRKSAKAMKTQIESKLNSVHCPDSLTALKTAAEDSTVYSFNCVEDMLKLFDLLEDESSETQLGIGFGVAMYIGVIGAVKSVDTTAELCSFLEKNNIDAEKEFGKDNVERLDLSQLQQLFNSSDFDADDR